MVQTRVIILAPQSFANEHRQRRQNVRELNQSDELCKKKKNSNHLQIKRDWARNTLHNNNMGINVTMAWCKL